jgi:hypothetical protein
MKVLKKIKMKLIKILINKMKNRQKQIIINENSNNL